MIGKSNKVTLAFAIMPQGDSGGSRILYIEDGVIKHIVVDHSNDLKTGQSVKLPLVGKISTMNADGTYNIRLLDSELQNIQDALGDERCYGDKEFAYLKRFNAELCNVRCSDLSGEGKDPVGWAVRDANRVKRKDSDDGWLSFFGKVSEGEETQASEQSATTTGGRRNSAEGLGAENAENGPTHRAIFREGDRVHAFIDPFNSIDGLLSVDDEFAQSEFERENGHLCEVLGVDLASNKTEYVYNLRIVKHGSMRINKVKEFSLVRAMDIGTRVHCTEAGWITRPPGVITTIHSTGTYDIAFNDIDHSGKTVLVNKLHTSVLTMKPMLQQGDTVRFVLSGWVRKSALQVNETDRRGKQNGRKEDKKIRRKRKAQGNNGVAQVDLYNGDETFGQDETRKRVYDVSFSFQTHLVLHEVPKDMVSDSSDERTSISDVKRPWLGAYSTSKQLVQQAMASSTSAIKRTETEKTQGLVFDHIPVLASHVYKATEDKPMHAVLSLFCGTDAVPIDTVEEVIDGNPAEDMAKVSSTWIEIKPKSGGNSWNVGDHVNMQVHRPVAYNLETKGASDRSSSEYTSFWAAKAVSGQPLVNSLNKVQTHDTNAIGWKNYSYNGVAFRVECAAKEHAPILAVSVGIERAERHKQKNTEKAGDMCKTWSSALSVERHHALERFFLALSDPKPHKELKWRKDLGPALISFIEQDRGMCEVEFQSILTYGRPTSIGIKLDRARSLLHASSKRQRWKSWVSKHMWLVCCSRDCTHKRKLPF